MILRGKFSPRRKALLALVLIVLAWLGYAWYANIAITRGIDTLAAGHRAAGAGRSQNRRGLGVGRRRIVQATTTAAPAMVSAVGTSANSSQPAAAASRKARIARPGADVTVLTYGAQVRTALDAALVAEDGQLFKNLLGMNFLDTLSGFEVAGDRLVLRD